VEDHQRFQLGILLVHGIGRPRPGDTLVHWGDALIKTIGPATQYEVEVVSERATLGADRAPTPGGAETTLSLTYREQTERWIISEGHWAAAFPAPTYGELVSWSFRALPWSIAINCAQRYWQFQTQSWNFSKIIAFAKTLGNLIVSLALSPVFIGFFLLVLLLGPLPFPELRNLLFAIQSVLTRTVGDSLAFVESPTRAALIRTRIVELLETLKSRCARTVVVAHSQGAAIVLDALGGMVEPHDSAKPAPDFVPDALLTFGSGTNQLASQKLLSAGLPASLGKNPAMQAMKGLAAATVLCFFLYRMWIDHSQLRTVLETFAVLVVLVAFTVTILVVGDRRKWRESLAKRIIITVDLTGVIVLVLSMGLDWFAPWLLIGALLLIASSMVKILSSDLRMAVTASVRKPEGLARWIDIYASKDPIPNGPTRGIDVGPRESIQISNLGSRLLDHTAYWDNRDEFVIRVLRLCAETAASPWLAMLPEATQGLSERAAWRVWFLRVARRVTWVCWISLFYLLWTEHHEDLEQFLSTPGLSDWLPVQVVPGAVLIVLIAFGVWVNTRLLQWIWHWWVRSEQHTFIACHRITTMADGGGYSALVPMAVLVWAMIMATCLTATPDSWTRLLNNVSHRSAGDKFMLVISSMAISFAWAHFSVKLFLKWKPEPHAPDPSIPST